MSGLQLPLRLMRLMRLLRRLRRLHQLRLLRLSDFTQVLAVPLHTLMVPRSVLLTEHDRFLVVSPQCPRAAAATARRAAAPRAP